MSPSQTSSPTLKFVPLPLLLAKTWSAVKVPLTVVVVPALPIKTWSVPEPVPIETVPLPFAEEPTPPLIVTEPPIPADVLDAPPVIFTAPPVFVLVPDVDAPPVIFTAPPDNPVVFVDAPPVKDVAVPAPETELGIFTKVPFVGSVSDVLAVAVKVCVKAPA
jgi:hypothetical protein